MSCTSRVKRYQAFPTVLRAWPVLLLLTCPLACKRILAGSERTSMSDVESNLEQLIPITQLGLELQVSPRFLTFGPLPSGSPWDAPVPGTQTFEAHGRQFKLKTGGDGQIRERYEVRACTLREIWSCVEVWATGRFGPHDQVACVGLRLEKGATIERHKLDMRTAENCPFMTVAPGAAQQIVRGIERAQLEHARRQEADLHLDPKTR